jgi:hypothetical protein
MIQIATLVVLIVMTSAVVSFIAVNMAKTKITSPLRDWLKRGLESKASTKPSTRSLLFQVARGLLWYFLSCVWCMSVWLALITTVGSPIPTFFISVMEAQSITFIHYSIPYVLVTATVFAVSMMISGIIYQAGKSL